MIDFEQKFESLERLAERWETADAFAETYENFLNDLRAEKKAAQTIMEIAFINGQILRIRGVLMNQIDFLERLRTEALESLGGKMVTWN